MLTFDIILLGDLDGLPASGWRVAPDFGKGPDRFRRRLAAPTTAKDLLEGIGVPHCEIGSLAAGGTPLHMDDLLDRDLTLTVQPVAPISLTAPAFICDQHLGALARRLRMLGLDTTWQESWLEPEIARRAVNEGRVVLSRSRALLKRKALRLALLVRSDRPDRQTVEVLRRFRLAGQVQFFGRCTRCNGLVDPVAKEKVRDSIPPRTALWLDEYYRCRHCGHLYWAGTHVTGIRRRLEAAIRQAESPAPDPPAS